MRKVAVLGKGCGVRHPPRSRLTRNNKLYRGAHGRFVKNMDAGLVRNIQISVPIMTVVEFNEKKKT